MIKGYHTSLNMTYYLIMIKVILVFRLVSKNRTYTLSFSTVKITVKRQAAMNTVRM